MSSTMGARRGWGGAPKVMLNSQQRHLNQMKMPRAALVAGPSPVFMFAEEGTQESRHRLGGRGRGACALWSAHERVAMSTGLCERHDQNNSACSAMPGHISIPFTHAVIPKSKRHRQHLTLTISSKVSSSMSTLVTVSSTSPKIMLRCWSYACGARSGERVRPKA